MAGKQARQPQTPSATSDPAGDHLRKIAESVDLLSKIAVDSIKGERNQKEMIIYLDQLGVAPKRIAELLNTTATTVNPTLSRARSTRSGRKKSAPVDSGEG